LPHGRRQARDRLLKLPHRSGQPLSQSDRDQFNYPEHVLHRIIDITLRDGSFVVLTKGDNEPAPDPFSTPASQITRRLDSSVPLLGYVLFYFRSTQGRIALAGLAVLFVAYEAVRWMTDTAEELIDEPDPYDGFAGGMNQLAGAISEYGEHLRSHTRVVRELGGTTEELHEATSLQRAVLGDLGTAGRSLTDQVRERAPGAGVSPSVAGAPGAAQSTGRLARDQSDGLGLRVTLRVVLHRSVTLAVSGYGSGRELLAFGVRIEALPDALSASLSVGDDAIFTVETSSPDRLLRQLAEFDIAMRPERDTGAPASGGSV
ncbi:MAG: hypothetical protein O3B31_10715, partial [Chloroflexi bacterium]|nr:hypothetical protein [Chloroflexota bacterium]